MLLSIKLKITSHWQIWVRFVILRKGDWSKISLEKKEMTHTKDIIFTHRKLEVHCWGGALPAAGFLFDPRAPCVFTLSFPYTKGWPRTPHTCAHYMVACRQMRQILCRPLPPQSCREKRNKGSRYAREEKHTQQHAAPPIADSRRRPPVRIFARSLIAHHVSFTRHRGKRTSLLSSVHTAPNQAESRRQKSTHSVLALLRTHNPLVCSLHFYHFFNAV